MNERLRGAAFVGIGLICALIGIPGVALFAGLLVAFTLGNPWPSQTSRVQKFLLQACVVLLGFGMDATVVFDAGRRGFLFAMVSIALTLLLGTLVGRWLGVDKIVSLLVSVGTAICGGSAIAAVGAVVGAQAPELAVAVGTVFLLNAVALYLFPVIGHALSLSPEQFGLWAGVAIHDVSSVVGAATAFSADSLPTATAVKLSRALWIVPVSLGAAWWFRAPSEKRTVAVPWFIGLFVLASITRSLVPALEGLAQPIHVLAKAGLAVVLFLVGSGLSMPAIRQVGWRPLAQGVIAWVFISVVALWAALQS